jgi:hypothetical protein
MSGRLCNQRDSPGFSWRTKNLLLWEESIRRMVLCVNEIIITKCGINYLRVSGETSLLDLKIILSGSEKIKK